MNLLIYRYSLVPFAVDVFKQDYVVFKGVYSHDIIIAAVSYAEGDASRPVDMPSDRLGPDTHFSIRYISVFRYCQGEVIVSLDIVEQLLDLLADKLSGDASGTRCDGVVLRTVLNTIYVSVLCRTLQWPPCV